MSHRQTVCKFDFCVVYKNIILTFPWYEKKLEQKFYRVDVDEKDATFRYLSY